MANFKLHGCNFHWIVKSEPLVRDSLTMRDSKQGRWLILNENGQHVSIGQQNAPSSEDLAAIEAKLSAQGLSGWLVRMEGDYYAKPNKVELKAIKPLCAPRVPFADASCLFFAARQKRLEPLN